ncbi:MAG: acyl carrier protein [Clostridia bacterium]|nr:acyl carrier protein [Clostridia bacterium]
MTFEKVRGMLAEQLQADEASITLDTRLVEDLKADSANVMVMILELESEFGIEVEDEVILNLKTVGDVVKYIDAHQG